MANQNGHAVNVPFQKELISDTELAKQNAQKFYNKKAQGYQQNKQERGFLDWLQVFLPCVSWLRTYNIRTQLVWDLLAGLAVTIMVIPQGASYAVLAGLPSEIGLYGAFTPVIIYSLFGSSRQLAVGPVAVTSALIHEGLQRQLTRAEDIEDPNDPCDPAEVDNPETCTLDDVQAEYNIKATELAFLVAILYTGTGLLRLGFITKLLSHSVISGFTTGASVQIALSQLKGLTQVTIKSQIALRVIIEFFENIEEFVWQEFVMGGCILFVLIAMKEVAKRYKKLFWLRALGPLTATIIGIIVTVSYGWADDEDFETIDLVGELPEGLPPWTVGRWAPINDFGEMIRLAIIVCLVDILESMSIATALAIKNGYQLDTNREIIGMGLANFMGAAFGAYSTTGSFSRSSINNQVGATSPLAAFASGVLVMLALLFVLPVFKYVPKNVLSAIVISAVIQLFDASHGLFLWKVNKKDFLVWIVCALGVFIFGVEIGLAVAIGLAILVVIFESAFPHVAELGRIPGTEIYRNVKQYRDAIRTDGIVIMRIDAPIYFANQQYFRETVQKYLKRAQENHKQPVRHFIVDFSPVSHIDAAGIHVLEEVHSMLRKEEVSLIITNPNSKVVRQLQIADLHEKIGRKNFFVKVHDAVRFFSEGPKAGEAISSFSQVARHAIERDEDRDHTHKVEAVDAENGRNGNRH